jgi:hypothetical protein
VAAVDLLGFVNKWSLLPALYGAAKAFQAGLRRGTFGFEARYHESCVGFHHMGDADISANQAAILNEFRHNTFDAVNRNRKAYTGVLAGFCGNRNAHADHLAAGI